MVLLFSDNIHVPYAYTNVVYSSAYALGNDGSYLTFMQIISQIAVMDHSFK